LVALLFFVFRKPGRRESLYEVGKSTMSYGRGPGKYAVSKAKGVVQGVKNRLGRKSGKKRNNTTPKSSSNVHDQDYNKITRAFDEGDAEAEQAAAEAEQEARDRNESESFEMDSGIGNSKPTADTDLQDRMNYINAQSSKGTTK
jgi:hypothetical protein